MKTNLQDKLAGIAVCAQVNSFYYVALRAAGFNEKQSAQLIKKQSIPLTKK